MVNFQNDRTLVWIQLHIVLHYVYTVAAYLEILFVKFYQITYCAYSSAPEVDNPRLTEFTNNLVDFG